MTDEITLTVPRERPFYRVAHLVLGGLAVRLDLTFETLEDLQLALVGLLERGGTGADITVSMRVDDTGIHTVVGPFETESLQKVLEHEQGDLSLRRVLETVADGFELKSKDGECWVELTKRVQVARVPKP